MALKSLNEISSLQDPLKNYLVEFVISQTPGLWLALKTQKLAGKLSGNTALVDAETLRLRCESFSYPSAEIKQTELRLMNFRRKIGACQDKHGIWKCRVTEQCDGAVLNTIQAWCDLVHNNISGLRLPSALYRGTAQVIIGGGLNYKGKTLKKRTIWLKGFYPIKFSVGDIDPNSSKPVSVDIEWNYDYFADNSYSIGAQFG